MEAVGASVGANGTSPLETEGTAAQYSGFSSIYGGGGGGCQGGGTAGRRPGGGGNGGCTAAGSSGAANGGGGGGWRCQRKCGQWFWRCDYQLSDRIINCYRRTITTSGGNTIHLTSNGTFTVTLYRCGEHHIGPQSRAYVVF